MMIMIMMNIVIRTVIIMTVMVIMRLMINCCHENLVLFDILSL